MAFAGKIAWRVIQVLWRYRAYLSFAFKVYSLFSGAAVLQFVLRELVSSTLVNSALILVKGFLAYICTVYVKSKVSLVSTFVCGLLWAKRGDMRARAHKLAASSGDLQQNVGRTITDIIDAAEAQVEALTDNKQTVANVIDVAVMYMLNQLNIAGFNLDSLVATGCGAAANFAVDWAVESQNMVMNVTRGTVGTQMDIATNQTNRLQVAQLISNVSSLFGIAATHMPAVQQLKGPSADDAANVKKYHALHRGYETAMGSQAWLVPLRAVPWLAIILQRPLWATARLLLVM